MCARRVLGPNEATRDHRLRRVLEKEIVKRQWRELWGGEMETKSRGAMAGGSRNAWRHFWLSASGWTSGQCLPFVSAAAGFSGLRFFTGINELYRKGAQNGESHSVCFRRRMCRCYRFRSDCIILELDYSGIGGQLPYTTILLYFKLIPTTIYKIS